MRGKGFLIVILNIKNGKVLTYLPVLILLSLVLSMCNPREVNKQTSDKALQQNYLFQKLLFNPLITIDRNISAFIDSDTLYLLNFDSNKELPLHFQLVFNLNDKSVVSQEITTKEYLDSSELMAELRITEIRKIPLYTNQFDSLIVTQYFQAKGEEQTERQYKLSFEKLLGNGRQVCIPESSESQKLIYNRIFQEHLFKGVFAKVPSDFYLLLINKSCYLITKDKLRNVPNVMLHFIRNDGAFDNYSFKVTEPSFEVCLDQGNDLHITKINLSIPFVDYKRIRIGEYGSGGNLWAQEYTIERLYENKLLIYEGEFDYRNETE